MIQQIMDFLTEQLSKNDLIAGGAVLGALAFILNQLRSVPLTILKWMRLLFITEVDVPDRTASFLWVEEWLKNHKYTKGAKRITLEVKNCKKSVTPAPGKHIIWWGWHPIILQRVRREGQGETAHRSIRESWRIKVVGKRKLANRFIDKCRMEYTKDADSTFGIRYASEFGAWSRIIRRKKRSLDSVILPEEMKQGLVEDIRRFIASEDWYTTMGIPWRRGYLLTGPPGNGKSSLVCAVASLFDLEIRILNLSQIENEGDFNSLVQDISENCILLLEDIDCSFVDREDKVKVTLSALLNALDGVNAPEGRLVFMTTNHPEKLDPALIRPGRVDYVLKVGNPQDTEIQKMIDRFAPSVPMTAGELSGVSMAELQGRLLKLTQLGKVSSDHIQDS